MTKWKIYKHISLNLMGNSVVLPLEGQKIELREHSPLCLLLPTNTARVRASKEIRAKAN